MCQKATFTTIEVILKVSTFSFLEVSCINCLKYSILDMLIKIGPYGPELI